LAGELVDQLHWPKGKAPREWAVVVETYGR
jgi:hypothetical protein